MRASSVGTSRTRSDNPVPRRSNLITRPSEASRSKKAWSPGFSACTSRLPTKPLTKTMSMGPSPTIWYAIETSPLFAYRVLGCTEIVSRTVQAVDGNLSADVPLRARRFAPG